ncbi:MAG: endopeptidase La [Actinobacteria bacterium ATB1]|nr:endopeptidase La [Actinobacteria bacterium ATB1]
MDATRTRLPLLPLTGGVVVPGMVVTVRLDSSEAREAIRAAEFAGRRVVMVPKYESADHTGSGGYSHVGCVASVEEVVEAGSGPEAVVVRGLTRALIGVGGTGPVSGTWVEVTEHSAGSDAGPGVRDLARRCRAVLEEILGRRRAPRLAVAVGELRDPEALSDIAAYSPELTVERKVELLETLEVRDRLQKVLKWAEEELAELDVGEEVRARTAERIDSDQREAILRRQLEAIRKELGESEADGVTDVRARLENAEMPEAARSHALAEVDRLERMGDQNPEAGWIRTWLDTLLEIPWDRRSSDGTDLEEARSILDRDHAGLSEAKERVVEHLAVRKLRGERGLEVGRTGGTRRGMGTVLLLAGPPGVGKTSLGESVARALGREFVRVALGGIRDEAEIRGHRRTYVGARPGRVARALAEAGTMNPVFLLDEVDKVGADWRGDPSSALLEVLDPAQNHTFRDHYLEVDLDLSDVVFIATANVVETIPRPLLDRMETIRLDGYTDDEKVEIARHHLLPDAVAEAGLEPGEIEVSDEVLREIVRGWTREAGVRDLRRRLGALARKVATGIARGRSDDGSVVVRTEHLREMLGRRSSQREPGLRKPVPGVATGLAVTGIGGEVLEVEAAVVPAAGGTGDRGDLTLTGQLGDVMKESAEIALSYVRAHSEEIDPAGRDRPRAVHLHVPSGAVPKDGPSAGVTMVTALASLLGGRRVDPLVGMTGEVTLQGRVLPIGGVKQKLLAARRAGLERVLLPAGNAEDLDEVPEEVLGSLDVVLVEDVREVLASALLPSSS